MLAHCNLRSTRKRLPHILKFQSYLWLTPVQPVQPVQPKLFCTIDQFLSVAKAERCAFFLQGNNSAAINSPKAIESDLLYPSTKIDEAVSVVEDLHQDCWQQTSALRA
jgi:hypothetical protein